MAKVGRKLLIDDKITAKLVEAFKTDFTQREACMYAGISQDTYQRKYKKDKRFAVEMDGAKAFLFFASKRNIAQEIVNKKSIDDSWKFLQKRQKLLYSDRIEQTGKDGEDIPITKITLNNFGKGVIAKMTKHDLLKNLADLSVEEEI